MKTKIIKTTKEENVNLIYKVLVLQRYLKRILKVIPVLLFTAWLEMHTIWFCEYE